MRRRAGHHVDDEIEKTNYEGKGKGGEGGSESKPRDGTAFLLVGWCASYPTPTCRCRSDAALL